MGKLVNFFILNYDNYKKITIDLNISLDSLTGNEGFTDKTQKIDPSISGKIMIRAQDGKSVVNCYKVVSCHVSKRDGVPKCVLFGIDRASFLDENRNPFSELIFD